MISDIILRVVVFCTMLMISNTTTFPTAYAAMVFVGISSFFYLVGKRRLNYQVVIIFAAWLVLNIVSSLVFGRNLQIQIVIRMGITFVIFPYMILDMFGLRFLTLLERLFLQLAALSLPLYILNWLYMPYFNGLTKVFERFTNTNLLNNTNYWSAMVYVNARMATGLGGGLFRNSGFMWEPGYFATIIVIAIGYRWLAKGIAFDIPFFIYAAGILTTFSTSGYLALALLMGAAFIKKITVVTTVIFVPLMILLIYGLYSLNFIGEKINYNIDTIRNDKFVYQAGYNSIKLDRLSIAKYDISRVARYPFGLGINDRVSFEGIDVTGTNGLTGLMRTWGLVIFLYFMRNIYFYHRVLNFASLRDIQLLLLYLSLLVVLFSQNMQVNVMTYFLIFVPILFKTSKKIIQVQII